jgi:type I restriction enzyme, S subunit
MKQGWEVKKLSEIGKIFNGNSINAKVKKDRYTDLDEGLPYISTKDVSYASIIDYNNGIRIPSEEKVQFKIASANTVLICAEGGSAGRKIGFTNQEVCFGNKLFALNTNKNSEARFVYYYYYSSAFQKRFSTMITGIIGGVSMNKFKNIEIPFPPLPDQKRIVAILDKAFATIAKAKTNAEQNLNNAKELFESYLQGVFEDKSEGWEEKCLGEFATFRNGINFTKSSKGDEIEIVGVKNFQNNFWVPFDKIDPVTIDGELNAIDLLKEGDILAVRSNGNPNLIGRTLLARNVVGKISHSGFTIRIRLKSKIIFPVFLCSYLKASKTREELVESGNGVGIRSLNQGSLSSLKIPFPKSLKEQKDIVKKLDILSDETKKLETIYQQKIDDLEELKKSVLQKAFNGELT